MLTLRPDRLTCLRIRSLGCVGRRRGCNDTPQLTSVPSVYVLNAAALSKPHAIQLLNADLISYNCVVAVVTETHFKKKQADGVVTEPGYMLWRRDRQRRRGGGVAIYVKTSLQSTPWEHSTPVMTNPMNYSGFESEIRLLAHSTTRRDHNTQRMRCSTTLRLV